MTAQIRVVKEVVLGADRVAEGKYVLNNLHRIVSAEVKCWVSDPCSFHQSCIVHKERAGELLSKVT